ncbi:hypothetical protein F5Y19DRAFT_479122 [Xylariaceae sp. FL1651]|nr:hypothetical protein F5Y19DRAFT_479122 [Xylariaceae sp. FL1651]
MLANAAILAEARFLGLMANLDQNANLEYDAIVDAGPSIDFPASFGHGLFKKKAYMAEVDEEIAASSKLTVPKPKWPCLNPTCW